MPLQPLELKDCPLLQKYDPGAGGEAVQLYEDCRQQLELLQSQAPHVLGRSDLESVLKKAYEKLTQPRYQVGLLGFFQSGKSTTLNRLLGFKNGDPLAPAKEGGAGHATTAVPTRVRGGTAGQPHHAWLEYLRKNEVDRLRVGLQEELGYENEKEQRLIAVIRQDPDFKNPAAKRHESLKYLHWLLMSLDWGRQRLSADEGERKQDPCTYEQRFALANHPASGTVALDENTLKIAILESVCLRLPIADFPPELEIVDLPGLGSVNVKDNFITQSFISEKDSKVDGALIFCEPGKLQLQEVVSFAQNLHKEWGELKGRAWMCFGRMDEVDAKRLESRDDGPSVLQNMLAFLRKFNFPDDQAVMISNKPEKIDEAARYPETGLAELNCESFRAAWSDLFPGGGISNLRKIVYERMPREICQGMAHEWKRKLKTLARDLASCGQCAVGAVQEPRTLQRGNLALNRLTTGITALQDSRELMASSREILQKELEVSLNELELNPKTMDRIGNFGGSFRQHVPVLQRKMQQHIFEMLDTAFRDQKVLIEQAENGESLIGLQIAPEGLVRAWEDLRLQDRRRFSQNADGTMFPTFLRNDPFESLDAAYSPFNGEQYIAMLMEKITVVSRQAVHAFQERILEHLWRIVNGIRSFLDVDLSSQSAEQSEDFKRQTDAFHRKYGVDEIR